MEHGVVGFIGFIVVIVLLTVVGSRLLGVRLSLRRTLLTGFPGLVAGFLAGYLVNRAGRTWPPGCSLPPPR